MSDDEASKKTSPNVKENNYFYKKNTIETLDKRLLSFHFLFEILIETYQKKKSVIQGKNYVFNIQHLRSVAL